MKAFLIVLFLRFSHHKSEITVRGLQQWCGTQSLLFKSKFMRKKNVFLSFPFTSHQMTQSAIRLIWIQNVHATFAQAQFLLIFLGLHRWRVWHKTLQLLIFLLLMCQLLLWLTFPFEANHLVWKTIGIEWKRARATWNMTRDSGRSYHLYIAFPLTNGSCALSIFNFPHIMTVNVDCCCCWKISCTWLHIVEFNCCVKTAEKVKKSKISAKCQSK